MPANKEYLTRSTKERIAKVSAAVLGGFLVAASSMIAFASWTENPKVVFMSYTYLMLIIWCALMLIAFLFRKAWQCWVVYGSIIVVFAVFALLFLARH